MIQLVQSDLCVFTAHSNRVSPECSVITWAEVAYSVSFTSSLTPPLQQHLDQLTDSIRGQSSYFYNFEIQLDASLLFFVFDVITFIIDQS